MFHCNQVITVFYPITQLDSLFIHLLITKFSGHREESCDLVSHGTNPCGVVSDGETEADHSVCAEEQEQPQQSWNEARTMVAVWGKDFHEEKPFEKRLHRNESFETLGQKFSREDQVRTQRCDYDSSDSKETDVI